MKSAKYRNDLVNQALHWLRFVIERPSVLYEPESRYEWVRCPLCALPQERFCGVPQEIPDRCPLCRWPITLRGISLEKRLSRLFQRALVRDPKLFARVKSDLPWL